MFFNKNSLSILFFFFFQAEDGIRDVAVTGIQTWLFRSPDSSGKGHDVTQGVILMAVKVPRPIAEVGDSVAYLVNSICDPVSHVGCHAVRLVKQVDRGLKYRLQKLVHSVSPLDSDGAGTPRPDEVVAPKNKLRMLCGFRTDQTRSGPGYDPANRGRMNPAVPSGFPRSVHPAGP